MNSHLVWLIRSTMEESVPLFPGKKPPSCGSSLALYMSFWSILVLHLLVIHAHTWVHIPSATLSDALWAVVTQIALSRGSRPHKWGQDVSCGYLIRRWQTLLELLLYHAPMVGPLRLGFPLGCSRRLPLVVWRFPLLWSWSAEDRVILGNISRQSGLSLFVLELFFAPRHGPRAWYEMSRGHQIFWPHT